MLDIKWEHLLKILDSIMRMLWLLTFFLLRQILQKSQKTLTRAQCTKRNVLLMKTEWTAYLYFIYTSQLIQWNNKICFWFTQHIQDTTVWAAETGKCQTRALYFTHFLKCYFNSKKKSILCQSSSYCHGILHPARATLIHFHSVLVWMMIF